jgi:hypothetical protein
MPRALGNRPGDVCRDLWLGSASLSGELDLLEAVGDQDCHSLSLQIRLSSLVFPERLHRLNPQSAPRRSNRRQHPDDDHQERHDG